MKKLNRKGFTLVELLAVIVILAIVVGITMMTILPTLDKSKQKSLDVAVETIKRYIQDQHELATLPSDLRGTETTYNSGVAESSSGNGNADGLLLATGYEDNISEVRWSYASGKATVTCVILTNTSDYEYSTKNAKCASDGGGE